jgi:hypothetical protein
MASQKIKKVIVPRESLPPVGPNNNYLVRYRIVSEDKNRYSHWSHLWELTAKPVETTTGYVSVTDNTVTVTWEDSQGYDDKQFFDVFIKVDDNDWQLRGSTNLNTVTFIKPSIDTQIIVVVQVASHLQKYNGDLVIYTETVMV